ncbi:type III polyketide synthase [Bailinhaonella thermotolerans]|uniref:Type III polyketide synthase n=1 Tax=Bailinhaonella thermotolerans TaxID=1070861 RepID=A0A3A4A5F7_9ACTN|nr:3-oxoacyl-[acyl-carrier-protein] synthase III C-terminal domain-containing protein [Bailinhaonella thermotolerans]RJL20852.1 type III polyketide synthase [Bailinhaonella thermotolerans]
MTRIVAAHGALPGHRYEQGRITEALAGEMRLSAEEREFLDAVHASSGVSFRHLALPVEGYAALTGFGACNDVYIDAAVPLGARALAGALDRAGLTARDVDLLLFASVTGIAAPSVDVRIAQEAGLRADVKRVPVFGLGCVAGVAGIARLHDYLRSWPGHVAALLSVELCSLTLQRDDLSPANLVASALFGDGAAAVVAAGAGRSPGAPGPSVVATRSHLFPGTAELMGWRVTDGGFRVVLDRRLPDLVRSGLAEVVGGFLDEHGLRRDDIAAWVCHPGGPKMLDAVNDALELPPGALDLSWRSLSEIGNLSSASVLHILEDTLAAPAPRPGAHGMMIAMGPGFCVELALLRW